MRKAVVSRQALDETMRHDTVPPAISRQSVNCHVWCIIVWDAEHGRSMKRWGMTQFRPRSVANRWTVMYGMQTTGVRWNDEAWHSSLISRQSVNCLSCMGCRPRALDVKRALSSATERARHHFTLAGQRSSQALRQIAPHTIVVMSVDRNCTQIVSSTTILNKNFLN